MPTQDLMLIYTRRKGAPRGCFMSSMNTSSNQYMGPTGFSASIKAMHARYGTTNVQSRAHGAANSQTNKVISTAECPHVFSHQAKTARTLKKIVLSTANPYRWLGQLQILCSDPRMHAPAVCRLPICICALFPPGKTHSTCQIRRMSQAEICI